MGVGATAVGFGVLTGGNGGVRLGYALAALMFLLFWATPGFKERPTFFGLGIAALVCFVADLFRDTSPLSYADGAYPDDDYYYGGDSAFDQVFDDIGGVVTRQGVVFLVLGSIRR